MPRQSSVVNAEDKPFLPATRGSRFELAETYGTDISISKEHARAPTERATPFSVKMPSLHTNARAHCPGAREQAAYLKLSAPIKRAPQLAGLTGGGRD